MNRKVLLMILDGWGEGRHDHSNAIYTQGTPNIDALRAKYPFSHLQACGKYVGLPDGQMGNSEVGHMNLGAGRTIYQDLVKINMACEEHKLLQNKEIAAAFENVKKNGGKLHLMGLCSHGGVHSSLDHVYEFLAEAKRYGLENVFVHCFMDGRDTDPHSGLGFVKELEEKMAESNQILDDGLLHAGIILKDKLNDLDESERMLQRLVKKNAAYEHLDDAYYHLYLLYNIRKQPAIASRYLDLLKANYPESQWTALLTSPYYEEDVKMGIHLEDSLYAATYDAFKANLYNKVVHNRAISDKRYPEGANRDKFLFIGGLTQLHEGNIQACLDDMQQVVEKYPNSRLSEMAGMILNGVKAGRQLKGGTFDLSNVWSRRNAVLNDDVKSKAKVFSIERNEPFVFMLAYVPDSVNENQLLFEMAKYNFTSYLVRNFDLVIDEQNDLHRMQVKGFRNYDEARQYANDIYQHQAITQLLSKGARGIVISEPNLLLLGTSLSYDDYTLFYTQHLAPLKISKDPLLEEPEEIIQQEKTDDSEENEEETGTAESGTTGTQGTDADIKEEKAPKTAYDNDDSLDLDSEEYDLDGF